MMTTFVLGVALVQQQSWSSLREEMDLPWPKNHTINIVCHGHSVPAGYAAAPVVDTFNAYPFLLHQALKAEHPNAVLNVIVTAVGGENAVRGEARFARDVLSLRPKVVMIDYALNDRAVGLEKAKVAWTSMVRQAKEAEVRVILLTPTPDTRSDFSDPNDPLFLHAEMIRQLAKEEGVTLADPFQVFVEMKRGGTPITDFMATANHPNRRGHEIVVKTLMDIF